MATTQTLRDESPELSWRVLRLLNLYRLLVPVVLWLLHIATSRPHLVGDADPSLFVGTAGAYLIAALASVILLKRRWPNVVALTYVPLVVDIAAAALFCYSSGGADSGLGVILLLPVGAVSLLGTPRRALVVAAAAALALLAQQVLAWAHSAARMPGFVHAGYYGAVLLILAPASAFLARRIAETEEVVRQRDIDVENLAQLSEYIVQHLRESLVVVDSEDRIRLINESACELLGPEARQGALLGEISPRLLYLIESWRRDPASESPPRVFGSSDGSHEIEAHFAPLGRNRPASVLIFLEETSRLAERVQQTKLAALGRLSASIAHEIRNPVGAMSHAAQLLAESTTPADDSRRLTEIITSNAERVSTIISNVLQLSRREGTRPERVQIGAWLDDFMIEFRATLQLPEGRIVRLATDPDLEVRVDPTHLHQIVWNLCDNAVRSGAAPGAAESAVEMRVGRVGVSGRPYLEVADRGAGIDEQVVDRIFEPFFTARQGGTGLGLFIARELAQCNLAALLYEPRAGGGSIFRVVFSDPHRWES
jgi:two-component system, NtrC family, sensor histidine kinase PilS